MKKIIFIFGIFLGFIFTSSSQTFIIAGQTTGTNIHYTDYLPDSSIYLGQNDDGFMLDIDNNGTYDLLFNMGEKDWLPYELWTWSTVKILNENVKIRLNDISTNWIDRLDLGDTISMNNIWSSTVDTLYYFHNYSFWSYPPPGGENSEGEYGIGYMGFQMEFPGETFYGWIHVEAADFMLTAKGKAIRGLTVGTSEITNSDNLLQVYPNPFDDMLTVEPALNNCRNRRIEIVNIDGRIVKTYNIESDKMRINSSLLTPGIYLIRIMEREKTISQTKVIKN